MKLTSNDNGLNALVTRMKQSIAKFPSIAMHAATRIGEKAREAISAAAPKGSQSGPPPQGDQSGTLANSFVARASQNGAGATMKLSTTQPTKLRYVTKGTGIYAGRGAIVPTTKKALYWKGAAHPMRSVKGQRANDFVTPFMAKRQGIVAAGREIAAQELGETL